MGETIIKIIGEVDLSKISKEDFKEDTDLRVAVVREGSILGSVVLKSSEVKEQRAVRG
jgi:hypothetical protein